jgi:hypothetical protein
MLMPVFFCSGIQMENIKDVAQKKRICVPCDDQEGRSKGPRKNSRGASIIPIIIFLKMINPWLGQGPRPYG